MSERLSALDASFLYLEEATTPMHVGGVAIFQPPKSGLDYDRLVELIGQRISLVPRYRQRIRYIPARLANPVWVDDAEFDVTYHVRRSALPKPGNDTQLLELVGRLMARRLDRTRPLWEIYLVEGLSKGRVAIITKTHHAMVDGVSAIDIGQVILDVSPTPRHIDKVPWNPQPAPSILGLVTDAVGDYVRRPAELLETIRADLSDITSTAQRMLGIVEGVAATARIVARPAPGSPLNVPIGAQRRFGIARTTLADYKLIRAKHKCTINDVVLGVVAGALRAWLLSRGEAVRGETEIRAMVPVSVRGEGTTGSMGNQVASMFVDLPVGEPNPGVRLSQIAYAMRAHKDAGQAIGAGALVSLTGFAPPTLHSVGARLASGLSRRIFNVVVTNVPGPQFPLYAAGAEMLEVFPVVPLAKNQALSIGLTSYNGGVFWGLNADRDAMGDVDVFATLIEDSLAELLGLSR